MLIAHLGQNKIAVFRQTDFIKNLKANYYGNHNVCLKQKQINFIKINKI